MQFPTNLRVLAVYVAPWLLSIGALLGIDAALFRTPLYRSVLEPESYAGQFERLIRNETIEAAVRPEPSILVLGDSRIAEGFSARIAEQQKPGLRFVNASVSGSTPRCWSYLLRELDPKPGRYKLIVLPVDDYNDEDGIWEWADRSLDVRIVAARLRWSDILPLPASFHSAAGRWDALGACLLKGLVFRDDLQAFLAQPRQRLDKVAQYNSAGSKWTFDYDGNEKDLRGLTVDWATKSISYPPQMAPGERTTLNDFLFRKPAPQTGLYEQYRRTWFRKIIDRYRGSGTRIFFVRLPRAPVPMPVAPVQRDSSIRTLARLAGVSLLPEDHFNALERPEYFFDALHLNARGRVRFSAELADALTERGNR